MNLRNKKVINNDYAKGNRKKIQSENAINGESKKESNSSESNEQTNLLETNENKKSKKQKRLNKKESQIKVSKKKEKQNNFLEKKRKRAYKYSKENERIDSKVSIAEEYGRKNTTFININESESEDKSIVEKIGKKKESPQKIKERTIFVKYFGEKIKESNLYEIFKVYGSISKVKLKFKSAGLVEFKDKNSIIRIINKKKIYLNLLIKFKNRFI